MDMYESDEEEEGVNLDVVRRQEKPREEIRVYMDPPIERADGDTNKDSGEKKIKQDWGSVADPEPLIRILIFLPIRILDPGSSTLLVTILWKKVEKFLKNIAVLRIRTPDPDLIFYPSRILDPKRAQDPGSWIRNTVSDNFWKKN